MLTINPAQQTVAILFQQCCSGKVGVIDFVIECSHTFLLVHQILFLNVWNLNIGDIKRSTEKSKNIHEDQLSHVSIWDQHSDSDQHDAIGRKKRTCPPRVGTLAHALFGSDVMHIECKQMYCDGSCCLAALCQ